jgi:hypothetical protein
MPCRFIEEARDGAMADLTPGSHCLEIRMRARDIHPWDRGSRRRSENVCLPGSHRCQCGLVSPVQWIAGDNVIGFSVTHQSLTSAFSPALECRAVPSQSQHSTPSPTAEL